MRYLAVGAHIILAKLSERSIGAYLCNKNFAIKDKSKYMCQIMHTTQWVYLTFGSVKPYVHIKSYKITGALITPLKFKKIDFPKNKPVAWERRVGRLLAENIILKEGLS